MGTNRSSMRDGPLADLFRRTEDSEPAGSQELWADDHPSDPSGNSAYVAVIRVVGIGGAGCNAINRMIAAGLGGVEFVAINTDRQSLERSEADVQIPIGLDLTTGRGTGGDPATGELAMRAAEEQIRRSLRGSDLVFITTGEGGGTGTGGAPVVAKIARELGALTIAVVTRPFGFEGNRRASVADEGIEMLHGLADTVVVIPNDRLMRVLDKKTSMVDAFQVCDDLLRQGVQGICDLITLPGLINLDFADVRTIIKGAGSALLGIGVASGPDRARLAAQAATESPLLETPIDGARGILLGITGGPDLSLMEVTEAARVVSEAADPEANIIFGATIDPGVEGNVWVTVVAANFSGVRSGPAPERKGERKVEALPERRSSSTVAAAGLEPAPSLDEVPEAPDLSAMRSDEGIRRGESPY